MFFVTGGRDSLSCALLWSPSGWCSIVRGVNQDICTVRRTISTLRIRVTHIHSSSCRPSLADDRRTGPRGNEGGGVDAVRYPPGKG
ncbi:hypothetical protein BDV59DRAFT_172975 [Aspergillus ambiguus]|uniref:uncharacterized protein n=1 Tax=Aspergillus ambiguus TaxID=176160 RepID=UPI003CCD80D7